LLTVIADKKNIVENEILINDRGDCNHIQNVYRLNVGDSLRVIDGEYEYATEITGIGKKK
jgi:yqeU